MTTRKVMLLGVMCKVKKMSRVWVSRQIDWSSYIESFKILPVEKNSTFPNKLILFSRCVKLSIITVTSLTPSHRTLKIPGWGKLHTTALKHKATNYEIQSALHVRRQKRGAHHDQIYSYSYENKVKSKLV